VVALLVTVLAIGALFAVGMVLGDVMQMLAHDWSEHMKQKITERYRRKQK
jgi:hypothetical protein